ncbi:hypothetical protein A3Q56_01590, partial [Intoshia linei]
MVKKETSKKTLTYNQKKMIIEKISKQKSTKISADMFKNSAITEITLSYNKLNQVPIESTTNLKNIIYFGLDGNKIKKVGKVDLANFKNTKLQHLELQGNGMKDMPLNFLNKMGNLNILDLYNNEFKIVKNGFLQDCPKLIYLKLHSQKLNSATGLEDIEHIDNNNVKAISDLCKLSYPLGHEGRFHYDQLNYIKFSNSKNIKKLNLKKNAITIIKMDDFYKLQSLTWLDLSYNQLTSENIHDYAFSRFSTVVQ